VGDVLEVWNNTSLNSFCGLYPLLSTGGLADNYNVSGNLVNPTQQQIIDDGPCITSVVENELKPKYFKLQQNYPNPFNPKTIISFYLPLNSEVNISLFDMTGRFVENIVSKSYSRGYHSIELNATNLASGQYLYILNTGKIRISKKLILIK
jgi:hypothetical protein